MDFSIIDTFVRSDAAPKTASRSADDAPESFAEILDTRMRQPEPAREKPEAPEPRDTPDAKPVETAEAKPNEPTPAAKPRVKPKAEHEAKDAATSAETPAPADAGDAVPPAKTPAATASAATLVAEFLSAGAETAADNKATGLEIATAIVTSVTPEKSAAATVLSLLSDGIAPEPEDAGTPTPATPANTPALNPTASAKTAVPAPGTSSDFAAQLNAAEAEADAAPPTPITLPETPATAADLAAKTSAATAAAVATAAAAATAAQQADDSASAEIAADLIGSEGEDTFATMTMGAPTPATTPRPSSAPTATSGYAAQLVSQEPATDAAPAPTTDAAKTVAIATVSDNLPQSADAAADTDTALLTAAGPREPVIAPATSEHSIRATTQAEATTQHSARTAALPVAEQLAVRITKAVTDGVDRINVKLNPADLGQIEIRMEIGPDGKFNAVFAADRPQTVELLQRDARELARSLQDAGLRTDTGSLSFNLRGQQNQGQSNGSQLAAHQNGGSDSHGVDVPADIMPMPASLYSSANAANGRVDIRV